MRRLTGLIAFLALLAACTGDSNRPVPTGKGTVRAINAIPTAPDIGFFIEERNLGPLRYQEGSQAQRWDDFDYIFNFEVFFGGATTSTRFASQPLKVDADRDYTLVVHGTVAVPEVTVWEADERSFDGAETVFQARFAHLAASLGTLDIYFADESVVPAAGQEIGTLAFGEILPPMDIESGDYVLSATPAGDPDTILYQSAATSFGERAQVIAAVLDTTDRNNADYIVGLYGASGTVGTMPDPRFPPSVRYFHASRSLGNVDIYDSDPTMDPPAVSNLAYGDGSAELPAVAGSTDITYTTPGDTSAILLEDTLLITQGIRATYYVIGDGDSLTAFATVPDRQSIETAARYTFFNASVDQPVVDVYVLDADVPIDDQTPFLRRIALGVVTPPISTTAGSFDLYVTVPDEQTVLAGPLRVDLALGDSIELIALDTADPNVLDFRVIPDPP